MLRSGDAAPAPQSGALVGRRYWVIDAGPLSDILDSSQRKETPR